MDEKKLVKRIEELLEAGEEMAKTLHNWTLNAPYEVSFTLENAEDFKVMQKRWDAEAAKMWRMLKKASRQ